MTIRPARQSASNQLRIGASRRAVQDDFPCYLVSSHLHDNPDPLEETGLELFGIV